MLRTLWTVIALEAVAIGLLGFLHLQQRGETLGENAVLGHEDENEDKDGANRLTSSDTNQKPGNKPRDPKDQAPLRRELAAQYDPDDAAGILVYGTVTDQHGKPADRVAIRFTREGSRDYAFTELKKPGSYAVTGLRPGPWHIWSKGRGYKPLERDIEIPGDQAQFRYDLVLDTAHLIKVKVLTPAGKPLLQAMEDARYHPMDPFSVVATRQPLQALPLGIRTVSMTPISQWRSFQRMGVRDKDAIAEGLAGELELLADPPLPVHLLIRNVVVQRKTLQPGADQITFEASLDDLRKPFGSIKVRILDATGEPLPGAVVRHWGPRGKANADGHVRLKEVAPGMVTLSIGKGGYESIEPLVRLQPGQDLNLGEIRLHKAITLRGIVVDSTGQPTRANLMWDNLDRRAFPQALRRNRSAGVDSGGRFELRNLGRSRYLVHAITRGKNRATVLVDLRHEPPKEVRLQLQSTVAVPVVPKVGLQEAYVLTVRNAQSVVVEAHRITYHRNYRPRLELVPGRYTVELHRGDELVRRYPLTVGQGPVKIIVP